MSDFQTTKSSFGRALDTRWRTGKHGEDGARPGQLDPTAFTAGTHYNLPGKPANNTIPSGTALQKLGSGLYGPLVASGVLAGYVNDDYGVELGATPATAKPTFALLIHGVINPDFLPIAAQKALVAAADTTGLFTYTTN